MRHFILVFAWLAIGFSIALAQVPVTGVVLDSARKPIIAAQVVLVRTNDSLVTGAVTDTTGRFRINDVGAGIWRLRVNQPGYKPHFQLVQVSTAPVRVPPITLDDFVLNEVVVTGQIPIGKQKGDTTEFNADAFKVNRDASAEDLVRKMPGVTINNGQVQSQGENVARVLVDGKPMFDNDPAAALRNLPAEAVQGVQVYDDVSDQARFSGFNDGQTRRTMNIITRPDRRRAEFGRLYGGYGTDDRYQAGGTLNRFRGANRLTILAQSNNTNQQNFAFEDLFSGFGGGGGQMMRMASGGGGAGGGSITPQIIRAGGGGQSGGNNVGNFFVGNAAGIVHTQAVGINFSDDFGKKARFTGSYFFNQRDFTNTQNTNRIFATQSQVYNELNNSDNRSSTHRLNGRLEWDVDSLNQIVATIRATLQSGDATNGYDGRTTFDDTLVSSVLNRYGTDNNGYTLNSELLYRHRFAKKGRTITLGVTADLDDRKADRLTNSDNSSFEPPPTRVQTLQQRSNTTQITNAYGSNLSFTEGLTARSQAEITYNNSLRTSDADSRTFENDRGSNRFGQQLDSLSNVTNSRSFNQQAGLGYRFNSDKHQLTARLLYSWTLLDNDQDFPRPATISQRFTNLLPSVTYQYTVSRTQSLRVNYRTTANLPQASQLQDVVDVSNPQRPSSGNPGLRQELQHLLFARWNKADPAKSTFMAFNIFATFTQDYIATTTSLLRDATTFGGVVIPAGAQFTRPENLETAYNIRAFGIFSRPVKALKSNLNASLRGTYSRTPGRVNNLENLATNSVLEGGLQLSSNISEYVDFTVGSNTSYNDVRNTLSGQNSTYWYQTSTGRLDWRIGKAKAWLFQTDVSHQYVTGLSAGFDQSFAIWNAAFGRKLFKNQSGEIKVYAFDLLKQNTSLSRNVTETYFEDVRSTVVQQYVMLILTYNFRKFRS